MHHPVDVKAEVEDPCFSNKRIAEDVVKADRTDVAGGWEVLNLGERERGWEHDVPSIRSFLTTGRARRMFF